MNLNEDELTVINVIDLDNDINVSNNHASHFPESSDLVPCIFNCHQDHKNTREDQIRHMTGCDHIAELGTDVFKSADISAGDPLDLTDGKPNFTIPKSIFEFHAKKR
jgi:hypothetical protein